MSCFVFGGIADSLCIYFSPKLKEQMQYCVDHPEEINKLAKVKAQVSEVKGVMMENIEKVQIRLFNIHATLFVLVDHVVNSVTRSLIRFLTEERRLNCLLTKLRISDPRLVSDILNTLISQCLNYV